MKKELKRIFYVTPTNFIELLKGYDKIIKGKRDDIGTQINKLDSGLSKLKVASDDVNVMTEEAKVKNESASILAEENRKDLVIINIKRQQAKEKEAIIKIETEKVLIE